MGWTKSLAVQLSTGEEEVDETDPEDYEDYSSATLDEYDN